MFSVGASLYNDCTRFNLVCVYKDQLGEIPSIFVISEATSSGNPAQHFSGLKYLTLLCTVHMRPERFPTSINLTSSIVVVAGSYFNDQIASAQQAPSEKSSKPETICEFGAEGGVPWDIVKFDTYLKAAREPGADFVILQFIQDCFEDLHKG